MFTIKKTTTFLAFITITISLLLTSCTENKETTLRETETSLQETKRKNEEKRLLEEAMVRLIKPNDTIVIVTDRPMTPEEIRKYPQPIPSK
jgi:DeoR/GlpR family transcriptional regulator of sugar metabolism